MSNLEELEQQAMQAIAAAADPAALDTVRVQFLSWAVYVSRQLAGQIPYDHRMASLTMEDWISLFCHVVPPAEWRRPLGATEIERAREWRP